MSESLPGLLLRAAARLDIGPVTLSLKPGTCLGISGESGSGKTVLLRLIADLDPHDGEIWLDGKEQARVTPTQWRRQVAWVPAESTWWEDTVAPHFSLEAEADFAALGFENSPEDWEVARLSTGEKQRLGLLRALQNRPRVLLLDEPTSALDQVNTQRVEEKVAALRREQGLVVIWVSHDDEQLQRVADIRMHMVQGKLSDMEAVV